MLQRGMTGRKRIYSDNQRKQRHNITARNYYRRKRGLPELLVDKNMVEISDEELEQRLIEKFKRKGWD